MWYNTIRRSALPTLGAVIARHSNLAFCFFVLSVDKNFSCLCINLNEGFAFWTANLRLPLQIHKTTVALRTSHLFQCQHNITPSYLQEQYSICTRNAVWARDNKIYKITDLPPKPHYGCRCYIVPVSEKE